MPVSPANALFSSISRWFQREPPVAVAAFGKSGVVNGHQDVAGDATSGMLETARILYYGGALSNCPGWEATLAGREHVLARYVLRWTRQRTFICLLSPVAEGGATVTAFAPFISCVEVDAAVGLDVITRAIRGLQEVESSLLVARPERWSEVLAPVRAALTTFADVGTAKPIPVEARMDRAVEATKEGLRGLGSELGVWARSLAEELRLPMAVPSPQESRRDAPVAASRSADAPRLSVDAASDARTWSAFLDAAGLSGSERWVITGPATGSVRILTGRPRDREFEVLWRSKAAADAVPIPIAGSRSDTTRELSVRWLQSVGLWSDDFNARLDEFDRASLVPQGIGPSLAPESEQFDRGELPPDELDRGDRTSNIETSAQTSDLRDTDAPPKPGHFQDGGELGIDTATRPD